MFSAAVSLGAAVIVDTVTRLIPGAVGNEASTRQESFSTQAELRAGQDAQFHLRFGRIAGLSALHAAGGISRDGRAGSADGRQSRRNPPLAARTALEKTLRNRPDLLERAALSEEDKKLLAQITGGK